MNIYIGGPTSQQVTNYVPQMTANTQDGYTATCSTQLNNTFYAWDSFFVSTQGGTDHCFHSSNIGSGNRGWSQIQLPTGIIVNKIEIGARKNESSTNLRPIGAFSLKGSNDGSTWTEIKAVSGLGSSWSIGSVQSWNITGQTTAYTYLKLEVQAYSSYVAFDYWNIDGVVEETKVVKNIYIGEYGWKPGSNTVMYLPLEDDLLDHSPNPNTMTQTGTITKQTIGYYFPQPSSGENKIVSSQTVAQAVGSYPFTVNVWCKKDATSGSQYGWLWWGSAYNNSGTNYIYNSTQMRIEGYNPYSSSSRYSIDNADGWTNFGIVEKSDQILVYQNGVLKITRNQSRPLSTLALGLLLYANGSGVGQTYSRFIVEKGEWTADNFLDHYNQTKSNYGL